VREWSTQERPKWTSREGHFARSLAVMTMTISRLDAARAVPDLYRAMNALDGAVSKSGLDARLQELLKFRVAQMNGCAYCMDMHSRDAIAAGERPERLHVLAGWRAAAGWFDEREHAALALLESITRLGDHGVPDDVYDAAAEEFSETELGALIFLAMTVNAWTRLGVATKMSP
jgi:AhpD family alkylhydroperoxidase